jgi:hypothetical protein
MAFGLFALAAARGGSGNGRALGVTSVMVPREVPQDVKDGIVAAVSEMTSPARWIVTALYVPARFGYEFSIKYDFRSLPSSGRVVPEDVSNVAPKPPLSSLGVASREVVRDLLAWHSSSI